MDNCKMVLFKNGVYDTVYVCSKCYRRERASEDFELNEKCPQCKREIVSWIGKEDKKNLWA